MSDIHYDLCVIGGGINGAGIARDAAGRGLSVLLIEAEDLAGATSSASSKLIHGGLRYLENYEFGMVRGALREREVLYRNAPHLIRPLECVFLQDDATRPQWLVKLGVWIYDHIGGRNSLPKSRIVDFEGDEAVKYAKPLKGNIKDGLVYYDCQVDDTRLVVSNAVDAAARGAQVLTHSICEHLAVHDGVWRLALREVGKAGLRNVSASMVVNATGPWVGKFLENLGIGESDHDLPHVRMVKGSHIILPRLYDGDHAYVLQRPDKRIVFVAPYMNEYTLVGTTEEEYKGDPRDAHISDDEMAYLCEAVNSAFSKTILPSDILFTYSGVRPLIDDGLDNSSASSREYLIYHHKRFDPPLLSVFGGKLTTYRALSEAVVNKLMLLSGRSSRGWSAKEPLSGGALGGHSLEEFIFLQKQKYPWLDGALLERYVRSYGDRMDYFLAGMESMDDLGAHYGDQVFAAEIDYLVKYEWARSAEDIIWRRSKLGLQVCEDTVRNIDAHFQEEL